MKKEMGEGIYTFPKGISLKVNLLAWLEVELVYATTLSSMPRVLDLQLYKNDLGSKGIYSSYNDSNIGQYKLMIRC